MRDPDLTTSLHSLADAVDPGPDVPTGAEVRAAGSRRRRRRTAVTGAAGALLVVALGGAALGLVDRDGGGDGLVVPAAPSTSPSATPTTEPEPSPAPERAPLEPLLLDAAATEQVEPGAWEVLDSVGPQLQPCGPERFGPTTVTASAATTLQTVREAGGTTVSHSVARHGSVEQAEVAVGAYVNAVATCPGDLEGPEQRSYEIVSDTGGTDTRTVVVRAASGCDVCYASYYSVQQRGDLVSVLSVAQGEDGDPGVGSIEPYLPLVADRLAGG